MSYDCAGPYSEFAFKEPYCVTTKNIIESFYQHNAIIQNASMEEIEHCEQVMKSSNHFKCQWLNAKLC